MKDILLLHGALGSKQQFELLRTKLEPEYTCHTLDFYGHGAADFSEKFGIEAFADQVKQYLQANKVEHPAVFGYSMGGYVALYLEANNPAIFSRIMTLGTKFEWNTESALKESAQLNTEVMQAKVPQYVEYLQTLHGPRWKTLCDKTAQMMIDLGGQLLIDSVLMEKIEIPVRIALGDKDKMVSMEETVQAFRYLPRGSFLVMPSTPHPLEKVNADRLAYKIRKFLES